MFNISAITGLTLPGIIEEPGCAGGSVISAKPVLGPELKRRKSFAILINSIANTLTELETSTIEALHCLEQIVGASNIQICNFPQFFNDLFCVIRMGI